MRYVLFCLLVLTINYTNNGEMIILQVKTQNVFLYGGMGGTISYQVEAVKQGIFEESELVLGFWNYDARLFHYKDIELRLSDYSNRFF